MDFLDNLENSLKNLESQEERDPAAVERRENWRREAAAAAPWAERFRNSEFVKSLLDQAALAGHKLRAKMYMAWLDSVLRLEVRGRWCELRPTAAGIVAEYVTADDQVESCPVDLEADPELLLNQWLTPRPLRSEA